MGMREIAQQLTGFIKKKGDTMTGFLTLHADPTANMHAATKQYVDSKTKKTLLWSNASPTSSFAAQDISTLDSSNYKWLMWEIWCNTEGTVRVCCITPNIPIGKSCYFGYQTTTPSTRQATKKSAKSFSIGANMVNSANSYVIPVNLYGFN